MFTNSPMESGSWPVSWLLYKSRYVSVVIKESASGKGPDKSNMNGA
jgi:hypothetical protein